MATYDLEDAIMQLHNIARLIDKQFGFCELSKSIRKDADELTEMVVERKNNEIL